MTEAAGAGTGNDTLTLSGDGTNTVATALNLGLLAANVENLDVGGTNNTRLNLTGTAANNYLTGNACGQRSGWWVGLPIRWPAARAATPTFSTMRAT